MAKNYVQVTSVVVLVVLLNGLISSCSSPFFGPVRPQNDATVGGFNPPELFERMLFPEKRLKRIIGFNGDDANDLDGDGIPNNSDPFPLDASYPGPSFDGGVMQIKLPLLFGASSYTSRTLAARPAQSAISCLQFNVDGYSGFDSLSNISLLSNNDYTGALALSFDFSHDLAINVLSFKNGSTDANFIDDPFKPNVSENLVKSLSRLGGAISGAKNISQAASGILEVLDGNPTGSLGQFIEYLDGVSWGGISHEPFIHLDDRQLTNLGQRLGLPSGSLDFDNIWKRFSRNTLIFSSMLDPGTVDRYYYSGGGYSDTIHHDRVDLVQFDNIISYCRIGSDGMSDELDSNYRLSLYPQLYNGDIDFDNMVFLKILIEKTKTSTIPKFDVRIFMSNKNLSTWVDAQTNGKIGCSLEDSGIRISGGQTIEYDITKDKSEFGKFMYGKYADLKTAANSKATRLDYEAYTFFLFFMPVKQRDNTPTRFYNGYQKWMLVGSNVHFWPLRDRATVLASVNGSNVTSGPFTAPYEYLMDNQAFSSIADGRFTDNSDKLYTSSPGEGRWYDEGLINVDAHGPLSQDSCHLNRR